MKYLKLILVTLCVQLAIAQENKNPSIEQNEGYDIVLVAGQSNTHYGSPMNKEIDTISKRVYALNRHDGLNYRIAPAKPILDFWTKAGTSFSTTFSNLYVNDILKNSKRRVLIIPCGYSGTSILSWIKNQNLYIDAIERTNYVLDNVPGSRLSAILWHQGESNIGMADYQKTLDKMIGDMRSEIHQEDIQEVPFIVGGMVPYWVNTTANARATQDVLKTTPTRVLNTGYADPEFPTIISKPNNASDAVHFDATGQREMGNRYYNQLKKIQTVMLGLMINRYHEVEYLIDSSKTIAVDKITVTANKNLKSAIIYDGNGSKSITINNLTANTFNVDVDQLPFSEKPYKLEIIDTYNHTHEYNFFR